jgi:hypothetical protein
MTLPKIYRAWINQPSTLQPLHRLHGTYCIAVEDRPGNVRLYFTEGAIHSMDADPICISKVKLSEAS